MKVKVSLIGLVDMLRFRDLGKHRAEWIEAHEATPLPATYPANELAKRLHPKHQKVRIARIERLADNISLFTLVPAQEGGELAPFMAGSYISLTMEIDGSIVSRSYSLCSSPKAVFAEPGSYQIVVKRSKGGLASNYLLDRAKEGDILTASDPAGHLNHSNIRDEKHVIGLAGGTGISPFVAMARAIADGVEDFELTIIYGVKNRSEILFADELKAIGERTGKVHVEYVLSGEDDPAYAHGFITRDMVAQAAGDRPYSVFAAGPTAFLTYLDTELAPLHLDQKHYRTERTGVPLPEGEARTFKLTVRVEDEVYEIPARSDETVLTALERGGLLIRNKCRQGSCGYCRSHLISGQVSADLPGTKMRLGDARYNYFLPCCTFPLSDLEIQVDRY